MYKTQNIQQKVRRNENYINKNNKKINDKKIVHKKNGEKTKKNKIITLRNIN